MASLYQLGRHWNATRLNSAMLMSYLHQDAKTGLDIGSNDGAMSTLMAKLGLSVRGIEGRERNKDVASILAKQMGLDITFEQRLMTLEDLNEMDEVDVSLLLSVHHQIVAGMGWDHANEFVRQLAKKTSMQFFFQPACIARKYKQEMPFAENDMKAIIDYFMDLLGDLFEHKMVIGYALNDLPKSEPLRPLILFSHQPIELVPNRNPVEFIEELAKASYSVHPLLRAFFRHKS